MGAGVAMKAYWVCVLAVFLTACGPGADNNLSSALLPVAERIRDGVRDRGQPGDGFTATRASLAADGFNDPFLVARLDARNIRTGLIQAGQNRGTVTWLAADGATLTERDGVLSASRGLGVDLYTAETAALGQALRAGNSASYVRRYRHLDPLAQIVVTRFDCTLMPDGREAIEVFDVSFTTARYTEICTSASLDAPQIENQYWVDQDRSIMRRSRQWISTDVGYLTLERVID